MVIDINISKPLAETRKNIEAIGFTRQYMVQHQAPRTPLISLGLLASQSGSASRFYLLIFSCSHIVLLCHSIYHPSINFSWSGLKLRQQVNTQRELIAQPVDPYVEQNLLKSPSTTELWGNQMTGEKTRPWTRSSIPRARWMNVKKIQWIWVTHSTR